MENKYESNADHEKVSFVKPAVVRNVKDKDFHTGTNTIISDIAKEEIIKNIEDKEIKADSKSSTEVIQEIKYDHNLTTKQLEREDE